MLLFLTARHDTFALGDQDVTMGVDDLAEHAYVFHSEADRVPGCHFQLGEARPRLRDECLSPCDTRLALVEDRQLDIGRRPFQPLAFRLGLALVSNLGSAQQPEPAGGGESPFHDDELLSSRHQLQAVRARQALQGLGGILLVDGCRKLCAHTPVRFLS